MPFPCDCPACKNQRDVAERFKFGVYATPPVSAPAVIAPPAILKDLAGQTWIYAGMSELGPAYRPQQTPLPMIAPLPAPVELTWANVTANVTAYDALGEYQREWVDNQVAMYGGSRDNYVAMVQRAEQAHAGEGE